MTATTAAAPSARRDLERRAGVTILLVVLYWVVRHVPAPFLAPEAGWDPRPSLLPPPLPLVSVAHVGLAPVLVAFVLVELFAVAVPTLRALRHGSAADRYGLGNGFAVLMSAQVLGQLPQVLGELAEPYRLGWGFLPLALEVTALAIVLQFMRGNPRQTVRIPVPTSGLLPWVAASAVLSSTALLTPWLVSHETIHRVVSDYVEAHSLAAEAIVAVVLAIVFGRLFTATPKVAASWSASRLSNDTAVAGATGRAHRLSIALVALGVALPLVAQARTVGKDVPYVLGLFGPALVGATLMDMRAEVRAPRRLGPLVPAFPLHRVYAVEPALAALAQAGIPATARARYFRALFHSFAPFAPIEILVPPEHANRAAAICARIARPEAAELPALEGMAA